MSFQLFFENVQSWGIADLRGEPDEQAFVCESHSPGWGVGQGEDQIRRSQGEDFIGDVGLHWALLEADKVGVMGCQDLVRVRILTAEF